MGELGLKTNKEHTTTFKVFATLSYIGNIFFLIVSLTFIFFYDSVIEMVNTGTIDSSDNEKGEIIGGAIAMAILSLICLFGVYKMHLKKQKIGLTIYIVGNVLFLFSIIGLISIIFMIVFSKQMKKVV